MAKTIGFIADSAADIPQEVAQKHNITIVPLCSTVDDVTYRAGVDVTNEEYYDILANSKEFPTTSQPTAEQYTEIYKEMLEKFDSVICVTIASAASGTNSVANIAAKEFVENGADITVVDSAQLSFGIGVPVVDAVKLYADGKSKEEIIQYLETVTRRDIPYFLLDDLTQLKKGGRIKASKAAIANLLDIKPILRISEGLTEAFDKVRGSKKSVLKLIEIMEEKGDNLSDKDVYVIHARGGEKLDLLVKLIEERIAPKSVTTLTVGPTISTHSGVGVVGVYFQHKV